MGKIKIVFILTTAAAAQRGDKLSKRGGQDKSSKSATLYRFRHIHSGDERAASAYQSQSAEQQHKQSIQVSSSLREYTGILCQMWVLLYLHNDLSILLK